jgi:twitching motility two-component system response regulator PilH
MAENRHILVIDDDPQLVETVTTLLDSVGYRTSFAYQAEKGVELARTQRPDLILLDVMFVDQPGPDGITLSIHLHEDPKVKEIPIIILSGIKQVVDFPYDYAPDPVWMPVKAFLDKPITPDKLLSEIEKVLAQS